MLTRPVQWQWFDDELNPAAKTVHWSVPFASNCKRSSYVQTFFHSHCYNLVATQRPLPVELALYSSRSVSNIWSIASPLLLMAASYRYATLASECQSIPFLKRPSPLIASVESNVWILISQEVRCHVKRVQVWRPAGNTSALGMVFSSWFSCGQ